MNISDIPTQTLIEELQRRNAYPKYCPTCNEWTVIFNHYDGIGLHCTGCNRRIERCTC